MARIEIASDTYKDGKLSLYSSNRQKAWLAEITGTDPVYKFKREFLEVYEDKGRWVDYKLEEGKLYNWNENREQHFGITENGKLYETNKHDALDMIKEKE